MERDMDLVRKILLAFEADDSGDGPSEIEADAFSSAQIGYHILLMVEGGLLVSRDGPTTTT